MENELSYAPQTFSELLTFADMASKTDLVPTHFKAKPHDIVIACQMGSELGLKPMQSLQNIAVINGRPSLWGDSIIAIISAHPLCEDVTETFNDEVMTATCKVKRKGWTEPVVRTFSKKDAENAGLWNKNVWKSYPKRMLQMRARGFACRDAFPDALRGLITSEEAADMPKPVKIKKEETDIESFVVEFEQKLKDSGKDKGYILEKAQVEKLQDIYDDQTLFTRCLNHLDIIIKKNQVEKPEENHNPEGSKR